MTKNFLEKLFEHNNWANQMIIQACSVLSDEQLDAEPQSVTKGTIRRTLIHLVNGTGHHDTAYFPPLEIRDIRIDVARDVHRVHAVTLNQTLPITTNGRFRSFTVPRLQAYEVIVVE